MIQRLTGGALSRFTVPTWVILASITAMAVGSELGGWRIIHTLGAKFYKVRPVHSSTSQIASAAMNLAAALIGGPVSTTHVVSSTILGVDSAERVSKVHWGVARQIVTARFLTIPMPALMAVLCYLVIERFV